jgi:uncharacterized protein (TIGR00369 family)
MGISELSDGRALTGVPAPRDGVVGTTLLIVTDQDRSREFYVNVLGASAIRDRDPVVLRLGGMWLILNDGGDPTPDKPETIATPPADRSRFSSALNLRVADIRSTWRRLQSAGAEFLTGPIDRGPEIRCYLHDPDGHLIEIGQTHTRTEPHGGRIDTEPATTEVRERTLDRAGDARRITVSWTDPATLRTRGLSTAGLPFLEAIKDGALPPAPIQDLLDFQLIDVAVGRATFSARPGEQHYNPIGVVHGGFAATLLDSAMGAAIHSTLPIGSGYTTIEMKFNLVRAITIETGQIISTGRVVHRGAQVCTAEARLTSASDDTLLAHGTSTCLVMTNRASVDDTADGLQESMSDPGLS